MKPARRPNSGPISGNAFSASPASVKLSLGSSNLISCSCAQAVDAIAIASANPHRIRAMVPPVQLSSRHLTEAPMRHVAAAAFTLFVTACGSPPYHPADAPGPVLEKLRAGEAPAELRSGGNPAWTAEIGLALAEDRPWKSDADAFAAIAHFAAHAGADQLPVVEKLLTDPKPERRMR